MDGDQSIAGPSWMDTDNENTLTSNEIYMNPSDTYEDDLNQDTINLEPVEIELHKDLVLRLYMRTM